MEQVRSLTPTKIASRIINFTLQITEISMIYSSSVHFICPLFKQPIILPGSPGLIQGTMDESKLMVKSIKSGGKLLNLSSFRFPPSVCHCLIDIIIMIVKHIIIEHQISTGGKFLSNERDVEATSIQGTVTHRPLPVNFAVQLNC